MSMLLYPDINPQKATLYTCMMAEGLCEAIKEVMNIAVQINGKTREVIKISKDASKEEAIDAGKAACAKWIENMSIVKEIYVPGKIVNIVVKPQ